MAAKVIAFTDPKGGVGKSTIALNFAFHLASSSKVLLIEADKQLSIYDWTRIRKEEQPKRSLPFDFEFVDGDIKAFFDKFETELLGYDYIVIDTAGRDSIESRTSLLVSDIALCPVTSNFFARNALLRFFGVIKEAQKFNAKLTPLIFLNNCSFSKFSKLANRVSDDLSQLSESPKVLTQRLVKQEACYENSLFAGLSIFEYSHRSAKDAREQLINLANEALSYE